MDVTLAYGTTGLAVELPDEQVTVIEPVFVLGLPDERAALEQALRRPIAAPPLRQLLSPHDTVAAVFCDITRPMPNDRVLPVLLAEIERVVPRERITLINGTGTHRANTAEELAGMLGPDIVSAYRIVTHDARDPTALVRVGEIRAGRPVWLNRAYVDASFRITTGFIEPHFFAGFSGGPKMVVPAVAGLETIMANHSAEMIGHENATWGITDGNPLWENLRDAALLAPPQFSLHVTLNKRHEITDVFAGDFLESHRQGAAVVQRAAMRPVESPFDITITTNSGYPLDLNVYQTIKGISAAARVTRNGGAIVAAAECRDGVPEPSSYARLLQAAESPRALLEQIHRPGSCQPDQWQVQIQAQIQERCRVYLESRLPDELVRRTMLEPCRGVERRVACLLREYGRSARICVLPQGPQTIPYVGVGR